MNIDEDLVVKIEAYLDRQMPESERLDFEKSLTEDLELQQAFRVIQLQRFAGELLVEQRIRRTIADLYPEPARPSFFPPRSGWIMALAGVVLAAVVGIFLFKECAPTPPATQIPPTSREQEKTPTLPKQEDQITPPKDNPIIAANVPSAEEIRRNYYSRPSFAEQQKSNGSAEPLSRYDRAALAFDSAHFKYAFQQLQQPDPDQVFISTYLRGHAAFNLKRYGQAVADFGTIAGGNSSNRLNAQWFELLALLCERPTRRPFVENLFSMILDNPNHPFYEQARALQRRLGWPEKPR